MSSVMHEPFLLVMYNRNHACLVSSHFSVLVERLVSVVVRCVVKDQQVGPFCSSFVYVAIKKIYNSVVVKDQHF